MKSIKFNFWLLLLVLLLALILAPHVESQLTKEMPGPAVVFLGWLDRADCIQIHLPNGMLVTYGGEKLEKVVTELKRWRKHASEDSPEPEEKNPQNL